MSLQILSKVGALSEGSELWIIPSLEDCLWSQRINWYLNFRISRAIDREPPTRDARLESILSQIQWNWSQSSRVPTPPLMVNADPLLPTRWVVLVESQPDHDSWWPNVQKVFRELSLPRTRFFLRDVQESIKLQKLLENNEELKDVTLVIDG